MFGEPVTAFVTNTAITHGAANGFDRGWLGDVAISFLGGGNTVSAARCQETFPTRNGLACPTPVPCP